LKGKQYKYPVSLVFTELAARETGDCEQGEIVRGTMVGGYASKIQPFTPSLIACFAYAFHILNIYTMLL